MRSSRWPSGEPSWPDECTQSKGGYDASGRVAEACHRWSADSILGHLRTTALAATAQPSPGARSYLARSARPGKPAHPAMCPGPAGPGRSAIPSVRQTTGRLFRQRLHWRRGHSRWPSVHGRHDVAGRRPPAGTNSSRVHPSTSKPTSRPAAGSVLAGGAVAPLTGRPLAHLRDVGQLLLGQPAFISPPSPILCPSCASSCAPLRMVAARTAGDSRAHDKPTTATRARGPHAPAHHPSVCR